MSLFSKVGDFFTGGNGGGEQTKAKTEPWKPTHEYMLGEDGIFDQARNMYQNGSMSDGAQSLLDGSTTSMQGNYDNIFNGGAMDPNQQAQNMYQNMISGQYTPQINNVGGSINPNLTGAAQNGFNANAQATGYDANMMDPNQLQNVSAQNITSPQAQAALSGPAAQMNAGNVQSANVQAAQQQAYTPTGQVAEFMNGGAYNNPMLDNMFDAGARKINQNFAENTMSQIGDGAQAAGQYGSSRQGIAEGIAGRGVADATGDLAANLYGGAYNQGFGAMSQLTSQQMQGDQNQLANNAGFNQQANMTNGGFDQQANMTNGSFGQQANMYNAGNTQNNNQFNAGNQQQTNMGNAGFDMTGGLANASNGLSADTWNSGQNYNALSGNQNANNTASQFNSGAANQFGLNNQGINANVSGMNAGLNQDSNQFNSTMDYNGQMGNAGLTLQDNQQNAQGLQQGLNNQLGAFGALGMGNQAQNSMFNDLFNMYQAPTNMKQQDFDRYQSTIFTGGGLGGFQQNNGTKPSGFEQLTGIGTDIASLFAPTPT